MSLPMTAPKTTMIASEPRVDPKQFLMVSSRSSGPKPSRKTCSPDPPDVLGHLRRAALAFAREVEHRAPNELTTAWWRGDRDQTAVFVDYNQNARDHTIASAYSVRGNPEGTVSTPIRWDEVDDVGPRDCTIATVSSRFAELGDLHREMDAAAFDLHPLLAWADRDARNGHEVGPAPDPSA